MQIEVNCFEILLPIFFLKIWRDVHQLHVADRQVETGSGEGQVSVLYVVLKEIIMAMITTMVIVVMTTMTMMMMSEIF